MRSFAGLVMALIVTLSLGACGQPATDLVVQEGGRNLRQFTLAQLQQLPQVEVPTPQSHGAQIQKGPTVRSVLDAAGATDITGVRIEGRDPAQTLRAAELTDAVVLTITKRSTLKLAGTGLDLQRWVRDVTVLVVNP